MKCHMILADRQSETFRFLLQLKDGQKSRQPQLRQLEVRFHSKPDSYIANLLSGINYLWKSVFINSKKSRKG